MNRFRFPWHSFETSAAWGAVAWVILFFLQQPGLRSDDWARLVLLLAAFVWVPLSFSLLKRLPRWLRPVIFPAALCLSLSMQMPAGREAALWSLPWLIVTAIVFIVGIHALFQAGRNAGKWAVGAGQVFFLIGGIAAMTDRLGIQPFGFDPAIVLLTAVHFHYAGLVFPLLLGWAAWRWPDWRFRTAALLSVLAVPLTAAGITLSQLTSDFRLETAAAATVVFAGWLGAFGYGMVIRRENLPQFTRVAWSVLVISLAFSMSLSLGYALRVYWPLEWLNIPAMRALHGTANAFGVAGAGLLGWHFIQRRAAGHSTN